MVLLAAARCTACAALLSSPSYPDACRALPGCSMHRRAGPHGDDSRNRYHAKCLAFITSRGPNHVAALPHEWRETGGGGGGGGGYTPPSICPHFQTIYELTSEVRP